jgi:aspartyl/glutamyl-tRNA(Asn/Gln) amidotransferase C subunit
MTELITRDVFTHLVGRAALELDEAEAEYLRSQLNNQLQAIHELEAIPLEAGLGTTSHGVPYPPEIRPGLRADAWAPYPDPGTILSQAPDIDDGYIVVPDIPHTELD